MVICNVVYADVDYNETDTKVIRWLRNTPAVNLITDVSKIQGQVPTLFYGHDVAQAYFVEFFNRKRRHIKDSYYWSYTDGEIGFENWIEEFIDMCGKQWFKIVDNGIDVVFEEFDIAEFANHLYPWPLVHEGTYEIYVADWRAGDIIIHSIKKDTLEYLDINPDEWLDELYGALDYNFLSIEPKRFDLSKSTLPIFLDDLLFANVDNWVGIDEIIANFKRSKVEIDRKKVITFYLRQSSRLRSTFSDYK